MLPVPPITMNPQMSSNSPHVVGLDGPWGINMRSILVCICLKICICVMTVHPDIKPNLKSQILCQRCEWGNGCRKRKENKLLEHKQRMDPANNLSHNGHSLQEGTGISDPERAKGCARWVNRW